RVYNYASFAKVFSKGIIKPNMTKIAKILFEPVISLDDALRKHLSKRCIIVNPHELSPHPDDNTLFIDNNIVLHFLSYP
ncbi:hypothetical protein, partial [Mitsuokella jalaludinii]|uniref:hypothetical protein n=1 Tax=Mitsuokella jalaludinii TaxID=187979 RepID=UPI00307C3416